MSKNKTEKKYVASALIRASLAPITVILLSLHLSPNEQGAWYLLSNLAMLMTVLDLGYTVALTQTLARLQGQNREISRATRYGAVKNLLLGAIRRALIISIAGVLLIIFGVQLSNMPDQIKGDFGLIMVYVTAFILNFWLIFAHAIMEGLNSISQSLSVKIYNSIAYVTTVSICLSSSFGVYSLVLAILLSSSTSLILVLAMSRKYLIRLKSAERVLTSLDGYQHQLSTQYLLSYFSGFVILQSILVQAAPFLSIEEIGRLGVSLSICAGVFGVSTAVVTNVMPELNQIYQNDVVAANILMVKKLIKSCVLFISLASAFLMVRYLLHYAYQIEIRMLPKLQLLVLFGSFFIQNALNAIAVFLRASGKDVLMIPSFVQAVSILIVNYIGFSHQLVALPIGFLCFSNIILLIFAINQSNQVLKNAQVQ